MDAAQKYSENVREIETYTRKIGVGMFTTRSGNGRLVSRPLQTKQMEANGNLWFFTAMDSKKVHELEANSSVNISYSNPGDQIFVSIDGRANVVRDRAKIDELWSEAVDGIYFEGGRNDPDLALIRVVADTAEVWTSASTSVGRMYKFLKAKTTGDAGELGEQHHVVFK